MKQQNFSNLFTKSQCSPYPVRHAFTSNFHQIFKVNVTLTFQNKRSTMPSNTAAFLYFDIATCFGNLYHPIPTPLLSEPPNEHSVEHIRVVMRATCSTHLIVRHCTQVVPRVCSATISQGIPRIYFCNGYLAL